MSIRIYADFNSRDEFGRVDLGVSRSQRDMIRLQDQIQPGMDVVLYFDDVEVDATLEHDRDEDRWYGRVLDWTTYRESK
jgi:hypothetical protein